LRPIFLWLASSLLCALKLDTMVQNSMTDLEHIIPLAADHLDSARAVLRRLVDPPDQLIDDESSLPDPRARRVLDLIDQALLHLSPAA
jgi:hypothetical protein